MDLSEDFKVYPEKCTGCQACEEACPVNVIDFKVAGITDPNGIFTPTDQFLLIDLDYCILCGDCDTACPTGAIKVNGYNNDPSDPDPEDPLDPDDEDDDYTPPLIIRTPKLNANLPTACILAAFEKAFATNQYNSVLNEFVDLVGTKTGFDVNFYEVNDPSNSAWAWTRMFENKIPGEPSIYYFNVSMNMAVIQNSAGSIAGEEAIVATMYHELIHAIMDSRKVINPTDLQWEEMFQHEVLARAYNDKLADILQSLYPGLTQLDAEAISWEGLQETSFWQQFQSVNPTEANNILLRGDKYDANGTSGTRCSP